jgi:hypothetical protein
LKKDNPVAGEYRLVHNPGYDFLRLLSWMEETDPEDPSLSFGSYLIPTIAVLSACCAIEGYTNMVGQKIDKDWENFDKGPTPIKDRLSRIYGLKQKQINFGEGIWQKVLELFKFRISLVHPRYVEKTEKTKTEIPDLFDIVNSKYSVTAIKQIAEVAVDTLLADTGNTHLRELYIRRSYYGPPRQSSLQQETSS